MDWKPHRIYLGGRYSVYFHTRKCGRCQKLFLFIEILTKHFLWRTTHYVLPAGLEKALPYPVVYRVNTAWNRERSLWICSGSIRQMALQIGLARTLEKKVRRCSTFSGTWQMEHSPSRCRFIFANDAFNQQRPNWLPTGLYCYVIDKPNHRFYNNIFTSSTISNKKMNEPSVKPYQSSI